MNILLPVEIASRELHAKLLLAHKFASENHVSYIGDKVSVLKFSKYTPGAVYFDKGYHRNVSESIYSELDSYNIKKVSLDEENAVDYHDYQQINLRFPNQILDEFSLIFLWGIKQYKYLQNNRSNFNPQNILVTGHPRFELLKKDNNFIYQVAKDKYIKQYGNFILINTNFGLGNNVNGEKFVIDNYGPRFPQIKRLIAYQIKQARLFVDLSIELSKHLDQTIILRPHPEESVEFYKLRLKKCKNVKVVRKGSVIPWIMASESMIHHDCTTGIECAMLGKNSIAYTKELDSSLVTDIPLRISYQYDSIDNVLAHIKASEKMPLRVDNSILKNYFNFDSNSDSIDLIVNQVARLDDGENDVIKNYFLYKIFFSIRNKLKEIITGNPLSESKIRGMDFQNIEAIVSEYNRIYRKNVTVKKIHKKLFQLNLS